MLEHDVLNYNPLPLEAPSTLNLNFLRGGLLHLTAIYRRVFDLMIGIPSASWRTFIYLFILLLFRLGREIYTIPTTINLEQLFISILNSIKNEIGNCYSFCCFVLVNKDNFFRRKKRETRGPCPLALTSAQSRIELMGQRLSLAKLYEEMPSMPNCGPNH